MQHPTLAWKFSVEWLSKVLAGVRLEPPDTVTLTLVLSGQGINVCCKGSGAVLYAPSSEIPQFYRGGKISTDKPNGQSC